jgi:hypothetical protein
VTTDRATAGGASWSPGKGDQLLRLTIFSPVVNQKKLGAGANHPPTGARDPARDPASNLASADSTLRANPNSNPTLDPNHREMITLVAGSSTPLTEDGGARTQNNGPRQGRDGGARNSDGGAWTPDATGGARNVDCQRDCPRQPGQWNRVSSHDTVGNHPLANSSTAVLHHRPARTGTDRDQHHTPGSSSRWSCRGSSTERRSTGCAVH